MIVNPRVFLTTVYPIPIFSVYDYFFLMVNSTDTYQQLPRGNQIWFAGNKERLRNDNYSNAKRSINLLGGITSKNVKHSTFRYSFSTIFNYKQVDLKKFPSFHFLASKERCEIYVNKYLKRDVWNILIITLMLYHLRWI